MKELDASNGSHFPEFSLYNSIFPAVGGACLFQQRVLSLHLVRLLEIRMSPETKCS